MSKKPEKVELFEDGKFKLNLTGSHPESLNNRAPYTGHADSAKIFGKAGSVVVFFDDQQFRTGENHVLIEKRVDKPIEVKLGQNFVDTESEAGNGVYRGQTQEFKWVLFKSVKIDSNKWWKQVIDKGAEVIQNKLIGVEVIDVKSSGKTTLNNYRVDNCSSVRFGE